MPTAATAPSANPSATPTTSTPQPSQPRNRPSRPSSLTSPSPRPPRGASNASRNAATAGDQRPRARPGPAPASRPGWPAAPDPTGYDGRVSRSGSRSVSMSITASVTPTAASHRYAGSCGSAPTAPADRAERDRGQHGDDRDPPRRGLPAAPPPLAEHRIAGRHRQRQPGQERPEHDPEQRTQPADNHRGTLPRRTADAGRPSTGDPRRVKHDGVLRDRRGSLEARRRAVNAMGSSAFGGARWKRSVETSQCTRANARGLRGPPPA